MTVFKQFGRRETARYIKEYSIIENLPTYDVTIKVYLKDGRYQRLVRTLTKKCEAVTEAQIFVQNHC